MTEDEIRQSMRYIWERMKIVIEPSAAVGLAVVLSHNFREKWLNSSSQETQKDGKQFKLENIGIILCGGMLRS